MAGVPPHKRDVNMVFQSYALFPHLSVAENVAFGLRIAKVDDVDGRVAALARAGQPRGVREARLPRRSRAASSSASRSPARS